MMEISRKNNRRIVASVLTGMFLLQQTFCVNALATSTITGITNGGSGTFDINPTNASGGVGFRSYNDFNLGEGDIANLIFKYGADNVETFINLMNDKAFNINGVINTMRDGNFYNGKAVFISPKGVVVGSSGVLNVGSLGIYTPDPASDEFNNFVNDPLGQWSNFEADPGETTGVRGEKTSNVIIDGKIFANKDVVIKAGNVETGANSGIFAGVANNLVLDATRAQQLFDNLVNTENQKQGSSFSSGSDGSIQIVSRGWGRGLSEGAGIKINGQVVNLGTGNGGIDLDNNVSGNDGINISENARVYNANGTVRIKNEDGNLVIAGKVKNDGNVTKIYNIRTNTTSVTGKRIVSLSEHSGLEISGSVETGKNNDNTDTLDIFNNGDLGLTISGDVIHTGNAQVENGDV